MIVHSFTGTKCPLFHITRRTPPNTILICFSESGKLSRSLNRLGFRHGTYCTLFCWEGDKGREKAMVLLPSGPIKPIKPEDLRYFYTADAHRRWIDRTHLAVVDGCHQQMAILQR